MTNSLIWLVQHPWHALAVILFVWAASHLIGVGVYSFAQARESRQRAEHRQRQGLEAAMQVSSRPMAPGINHRRIS